jgi:hypothetical protein
VKSYGTERVALDRYEDDVCQVTRYAVNAGKGRAPMLIEPKELFETKAEALEEFRRRCGRPQPTSTNERLAVTPLDRGLRKINRLRLALEDALPGWRDFVALKCPDLAVRERDLSMLRRVEEALHLLRSAVPHRAGSDVRSHVRRQALMNRTGHTNGSIVSAGSAASLSPSAVARGAPDTLRVPSSPRRPPA